ncbi:MAG: hypothetical protein IT480_19050 [Gammaproteobacteria bacterium]|nr:hypothetical protein [Gammaproteobacteria bacterium]
MSEANPAQAAGSDEALSFNDGADAISNLLADPAETLDLSEEDQGQEEATEETETEGDEPEVEATEEATEEEEPEQEEGGPGYESGKFAADTANVRLKDGTVISVQDLKRGYLSQSSFTRGTQENAREREALTAQKSEVEQTAQTLKAQRDFLLQVSQQVLPPAPDESLLNQNSASYDPIRYMAEKADYDRKVGALTQLQQYAQAEQARTAQEQQRQQNEVRDREAKLLLDAMPELKKPEAYSKFWAEAVDTMAEYGFSAEEMNATVDHRVYRLYRDLAAYRRARKNIPTVKQAVQSKPVLSGKKRMDPKAKSSREHQVRSDHLRKTGSFDAGVNALMDLDL